MSGHPSLFRSTSTTARLFPSLFKSHAFFVKLNVVGHKKIELPVAVVVEPPRRRRPSAIIPAAGFCRYIGESPIPIVVIQHRMPVAGHINVREPVVIKIADGYTKEKCPVRSNTRLLRHVRERPIAIVAVKRRLRRLLRMKKWCEATIHEKRVEPAILVVIHPCDTRSHRLRVKLLLRRCSFVMKTDPRRPCHIPELHVVAIRAGLPGRCLSPNFRGPCAIRILRSVSGSSEEKSGSQCDRHDFRGHFPKPCFILEHHRK